MTADPHTDDDGPDMRAAEYALRLLDGTELAEAEQRLDEDPAFAAEVTQWQMQFAELADDLDPVDPGPAVRQALMVRLFPDTAPRPLWRRISIWQGASLASALLIAGLILFSPLSGFRPAGPLYTAEIVAEAGDFRVVAVVDKVADVVVLTRTRGAAPEGRILQVWAHGPGAPAESVGLWPAGDVVRLPLPQTIAAVEGVLTIGVSEEPPGGSVTGSPSGRVFGTVDIPGVGPAI